MGKYLLVGKRRLMKLKPDATSTVQEVCARIRAKGKDAEPCSAPPSISALTRQEYNGVVETPDGCEVEPDGECCHGYPSWLIILGII